MTTIIDGTAGVTFPAGGVGNPASAVVGLTDTQTLTNKSIVATQLTGTIAVARLPTGSVLQVVNATYSTETSNSTATYADTGLSASITPSNSSSKILILVSQSGVGKSNDNAGSGCTVNLLRNSTQLIEFVIGGGRTVSTLYNLGLNATACYLDSPSTTSSTTYKTQFKNYNSGAAVYVQGNNATSTITLMEIAA